VGGGVGEIIMNEKIKVGGEGLIKEGRREKGVRCRVHM
jgi:hypothetical protein